MSNFNEYQSFFPDDALKIKTYFPSQLSSLIYCCKDGVILLRYINKNHPNSVEISYFNLYVAELHSQLPSPTKNGIQIVPMNFLGAGKLVDCKVNEIEIEYLDIGKILYADDIEEVWEDTINDFELFLIGINSNFANNENLKGKQQKQSLIDNLEKLLVDFVFKLENSKKEEEIQVFLSEHSILIQQNSRKIPKQKLGEDLVTDFVLLNVLEQGNKYTFVEIEKSSMPIFTKSGEFTSEFKHAEIQTLDWDIWLEKNKSYLQNKLVGLESPNYLIIAGRGNNFSDDEKALLRAWNRSKKNVEFLTYDDLVKKTRELIDTLKYEDK